MIHALTSTHTPPQKCPSGGPLERTKRSRNETYSLFFHGDAEIEMGAGRQAEALSGVEPFCVAVRLTQDLKRHIVGVIVALPPCPLRTTKRKEEQRPTQAPLRRSVRPAHRLRGTRTPQFSASSLASVSGCLKEGSLPAPSGASTTPQAPALTSGSRQSGSAGQGGQRWQHFS